MNLLPWWARFRSGPRQLLSHLTFSLFFIFYIFISWSVFCLLRLIFRKWSDYGNLYTALIFSCGHVTRLAGRNKFREEVLSSPCQDSRGSQHGGRWNSLHMVGRKWSQDTSGSGFLLSCLLFHPYPHFWDDSTHSDNFLWVRFMNLLNASQSHHFDWQDSASQYLIVCINHWWVQSSNTLIFHTYKVICYSVFPEVQNIQQIQEKKLWMDGHYLPPPTPTFICLKAIY